MTFRSPSRPATPLPTTAFALVAPLAPARALRAPLAPTPALCRGPPARALVVPRPTALAFDLFMAQPRSCAGGGGCAAARPLSSAFPTRPWHPLMAKTHQTVPGARAIGAAEGAERED